MRLIKSQTINFVRTISVHFGRLGDLSASKYQSYFLFHDQEFTLSVSEANAEA